MQAPAAELRQKWNGTPCVHPRVESGRNTGEYVCTACGEIITPQEAVQRAWIEGFVANSLDRGVPVTAGGDRDPLEAALEEGIRQMLDQARGPHARHVLLTNCVEAFGAAYEPEQVREALRRMARQGLLAIEVESILYTTGFRTEVRLRWNERPDEDSASGASEASCSSGLDAGNQVGLRAPDLEPAPLGLGSISRCDTQRHPDPPALPWEPGVRLARVSYRPEPDAPTSPDAPSSPPDLAQLQET
jgi:hypothetical protein